MRAQTSLGCYTHSDMVTPNKGGAMCRVAGDQAFANLAARLCYAAGSASWARVAEMFPDADQARMQSGHDMLDGHVLRLPQGRVGRVEIARVDTSGTDTGQADIMAGVVVLTDTDFAARTPQLVAFARQVCTAMSTHGLDSWSALVQAIPGLDGVHTDLQRELGERVVVEQACLQRNPND